MIFNKHSNLEGLHAFLSASNYHWLRYDEDKLITVYENSVVIPKRGTEIHQLASEHIKLGIKMPKTHTTLNDFVNDAIGYRMGSEVILRYSDVCFGTADAICFRGNTLRIHDLKTGVKPAKMDQLYVYAALFCLEYRIKPHEIKMELRIYQNNEIKIDIPDPDDIAHIMDKIVRFSQILMDRIASEED